MLEGDLSDDCVPRYPNGGCTRVALLVSNADETSRILRHAQLCLPDLLEGATNIFCATRARVGRPRNKYRAARLTEMQVGSVV